MKLIITILLVIKFGFWCRAQVFDDFADGDFIENPAWLGDDSLFIINENKQLQLNAVSGNNACLSVAYKKEEELEWRFWIKEKFSPSGNNYCDVYLISDSRDFRTSNQIQFAHICATVQALASQGNAVALGHALKRHGLLTLS